MTLQQLEAAANQIKQAEANLHNQLQANKNSLKQELFNKVFAEMGRLQISVPIEIQMWSFDDQPWNDGGATYPVSPCLRISYDFESEFWFEDMETFLQTIPDEVRFLWMDSQRLGFDPINQTVTETDDWFGDY